MRKIDLKYHGAVAVLAMNDGENRFNPTFVSAIHKALDEIESNDSARAAIIAGTGKYFSNGLDLDGLAKLPPDDLKAFQGEFHRLLKRLAVYPMPTVGAINGHAFAGGAILAALMDFRLMRSDRGWFCLPEVDINIPYFWPGMLAILRWAVPKPHLRDMLLTGKRYTAGQLLEMGFIESAESAEELMGKCIEFAAPLAAKNTAAYAEIKSRMKSDMLRIMEEDPRHFW